MAHGKHLSIGTLYRREKLLRSQNPWSGFMHEQIACLRLSGLGCLQILSQGVNCKRTGNLPSRVSTHAVRDDIEMQLGKEAKGVLVRATVLTLLRSDCSADSHKTTPLFLSMSATKVCCAGFTRIMSQGRAKKTVWLLLFVSSK